MSVYSFGLGINGELGQGDSCESLDLPKKLQYFSDINKRVKKIACGSYHTVFITDDEQLYLTGIGQDPKTGSTLFALETTTTSGGGNNNNTATTNTSNPSPKNGASVGGSGNTSSRIPHNLSTRHLLKPSNSQEEKQLQSALAEFQEVVKTNGPPSGGSTPPLTASSTTSTSSSPAGGSCSTSPSLNSVQQQQHPQHPHHQPSILTSSMTQQNIEYVKPKTIPTLIPLSFIDSSNPANKIKQVSLGNYHIVILTESGNVWSWGTNTYGQLGIGSTIHSNHPKMVELKCVRSIATGVKHTAALNEWGELYMWGINEQGELGLGDTNNRLSPTRVSRLKSEFVNMVACSSTHSICTTDSGRLYTWGQSDKLGKVQSVPSLVLTTGDGSLEREADGGGFGGGGEIRQIACGEWMIGVLTQMGEVFMWELGAKPTPIHHTLANHSVRAIAMGNFHMLCLTDSGEVLTVGRNKSGQLGRIVQPGSGTNIPGIVKELSHHSTTDDKGAGAGTPWVGLRDDEYVVQIHAGEYHSIALVENTPKTKIALRFLKMQRNYLRQLNVLNNIYYKSFMSIATPSDPALTQQLLSLSNSHYGISGSNSEKSSGLGGAGENKDKDKSTGGSSLSSSRDLASSGSNNTPGSPSSSAPISSSTSHSTPNLLNSSGSGGTIRSRSTSMATIRGILGLSAISNMSIEDNVAVTEEEVIGIFSDIRSLIRSTQILLSKLDQRIDSYDPEQQILGDIFLEESVLSSYRCYIPFSDNYNSACMTLFNIKRRSEKVANLLKECEKRTQAYGVKLDSDIVQLIDLKSLLLSPLQNIPRIFMMLGELSMSTSPKHKDIDLLNQSAGKFQVLFERMNQNFQFVDAVEILNCSSNEYGNPQVMGGSLKQLVEKLTHHNISDPYFNNVFLLTFRNFSKPLELLDLLIEKYEKYPLARGRVINVLSNWIINYFYDFENDPIQTIIDPPDHHPEQLSQKLEKFLQHTGDKLLNSAKAPYEAQRKKDYSTRYNAISVIIPQVVTPPSISLLDFNANEIGQTLTILNHLYYAKIDKRELLNQRWTKKKAPNIQSSTDHFNRISQLVVTEIIQCKNSKSRASVITHFLSIAQTCFELNNFTGVASIIYGLNNATVSKLKKTWSKLSKDSFNTYEYLEKIVTPMKNYISLRHIMATVQPPCTPFIGIYLKDLTFIEDGNPPQIGGLINFYKQRKIAEVVFQIQQFQQVLYTNITPNITIRDYLLAAPLLEEKKAQSMASGYE